MLKIGNEKEKKGERERMGERETERKKIVDISRSMVIDTVDRELER